MKWLHMMNNGDLEKVQRLRDALTKTSQLSFEEAQSRLPELVMAKLAGEDIDSMFSDVLAALDQYPELAEEYAALIQEVELDLADQSPIPRPSTTPQFFPRQKRRTPGLVLRQWGDQARQLLLQLLPRQPLEAQTGLLSGEAIEYINEYLPDLPEPIQLSVELQAIEQDVYEVVISIVPVSTARWHVTATLAGNDLPILDRSEYVTRFGPLSNLPTAPITVVCRVASD